MRAGSGGLLDSAPLREVFAEWVEGAARATRPPPSPEVIAYLVDLLASQLRAPRAPGRRGEGPPSLAEEWLAARRQTGSERLRRLHRLGDRALFVSGFFGDSLERSRVDLGYYREIGRSAYGNLARFLAAHSWTPVFEELADRFGDLGDLLAEVGDRARPGVSPDLLRLYERSLETGSPRDRRRLLRLGHRPPARRVWQ